MGLFKKFRDAWFAPMSFDSLDDDFYDRLEESLILADVVHRERSLVNLLLQSKIEA